MTGREKGWRGKRAFDVIVTAATAPLWLPVLAAVGFIVRARLGPPVMFRQERAGLHGKPFRLMKFRSLTVERDPHGLLLPDAERLTPFGRALRSSSLDELPELFNVLRGDMSLVGPRPLFTSYLPLYSARHARRHEVRPGITGLAQVRGRNAIGWKERLDLDVEYVDASSLSLDLRILVGTLRAVFTRRGVSAPGAATMPVFTGYDQEPIG